MNRKDKNTEDTLSAALDYYERGYSIIPIGNNKKPLVSWKQYQDNRASKHQIQQWFKKYPDMNIGIVTGEISNLVVVDIEKGGSTDGYPPTITSKTGGGGWHLYYRHPDNQVKNETRVKELTDIRGDGGYVIAPPSGHPSGGQYEWQVSFNDVDLAQFPLHLFTSNENHETDWHHLLDKSIPKGARNDTAARVAGKFLQGLPKSARQFAWQSFQSWNENQCKPPLETKELRQVWDSIKKREDEGKETNSKNSDNKSQKNRVVEMVLENDGITLFHDTTDRPYVSIGINNHTEIWPVESKQFRQWLSHNLWKGGEEVPGSGSVNDALATISGAARFDADKVKLSNRCRMEDDVILYDTANEDWSVIQVDDSGWRVLENNPAVFRRYGHQDAQVAPSSNGDAERVFDFVNVNEGEQLLFLVYLISCFVPNIPHPIPYVYGPQGSAKSTLSKVVKEIVDPSQIEVTSFPSGKEELVQLLSHHHLLFFDNLSSLSRNKSDMLCRVVTGTGFSKRELYTNEDDMIFHLKRCVGLNGINITAKRSDLLERCILFQLDRVPKSGRRTEKEFWESFEKSKPVIIGGILDTLSEALGRVNNVDLSNYPRMADFCQWGYAIAESLGYDGQQFIDLYKKNIDDQHREVVYGSPLGKTMMIFAQYIPGGWSGTATELLSELQEIAKEEEIDAYKLPSAANALSRKLNEMETNFAEVGVEINRKDDTNDRRIFIENTNEIDGKDAPENDPIDVIDSF